ncbi:glucocorticoid receptor-like (DNA-binding domain) [Lentinula edodes]|uniref:Glucocorticoid receptor-like (DNA-binding domain) n=1 Tax=Lentinula edodes TaxID=5353 RepID=A0A1Q3E3U4_LENED|nr:glucocorticoid receptor-like (DNA-binding domain) [Lentinula edodes]
MGLRPNIRVLRDMKARQGVLDNEVTRRAYLFVLNTFGRYTRPTTVKNRCYESGRGRGIMSEFGLCRYQFRHLGNTVCSRKYSTLPLTAMNIDTFVITKA